MAYSKDMIRLTVAVKPELNEKLEALSEAMHVSKTACIVMILEKNIDLFTKAFELITKPLSFEEVVGNVNLETEKAKTEFAEFKKELENNSEGVKKIKELNEKLK